MRVGLDGMLLAVNDASLQLLKAQKPADLLATRLQDRVHADDRQQWDQFVARLQGGASSSFECGLDDGGELLRRVLVQGVPLLDHPDGVASIIVSVRDTSAQHRLETTLQSTQAATEQQERLQAELDHAIGESRRLARLLEEHQAEQQQLAEQHASERSRSQQALAEDHQLQLMLKEREAHQQLSDLRQELDRAVAEQRRLAGLLHDKDAEHALLRSEQQREQAALRDQLEQQKREATDIARETAASLTATSEEKAKELESALAESLRLERLLDTRDQEYALSLSRKQEEADALRRELEQQTRHVAEAVEQLAAARTASETKEREVLDRLSNVRQDLDRAVAESGRLEALLQTKEREHAQALARQQHETDELRHELEQQTRRTADAIQEATAATRMATEESARTQTTEDQARLAERVGTLEAERDRMAAESAAQCRQLEQQLIDQRAAYETSAASAARELGALREAMEQARGEEGRLRRAVEEAETRRQALTTEFDQERHRLECALAAAEDAFRHTEQGAHQHADDLRTRLAAAVAEQQRLAQLVDELSASQHQSMREREAEVAVFQTALANAEEAAREMRVDLERAELERHRLLEVERWHQSELSRVEDLRRDFVKQLQDRDAEIAAASGALDEALLEQQEIHEASERREADLARAEQARDEAARRLSAVEVDVVNLRAALAASDRTAESLREQLELLGVDRVQLQRVTGQHETAIACLEESRQALTARLSERDAETALLREALVTAEHAVDSARQDLARQELERQQLRDLVDERESELTRLAAERLQLAARLAEREDDAVDLRQRLALAERTTTRLQQELDDADAERGQLLDAVAAHQSAIALSEDQIRQLAVRLSDRDGEIERLQADAVRLDAAHAADLQQLAESHAADRAALEHALDAQHRGAVAALQQQFDRRQAQLARQAAEEHVVALGARDREADRRLESIRLELDQATSELHKLRAQVAGHEEERQRLIAAHAAEQLETERRINDAAQWRERSAKALEDQRVELHGLSETVRALEPLAAAGRSAYEVARDLQRIMAALDARAKFLVTQFALATGGRQEVEALRADALRAASLARQIVHGAADPPSPSAHDEMFAKLFDLSQGAGREN